MNPGNNSLVITDYADNLQRIARIIAAMDVSNASDVEIIPLQNAVASELAPLVSRLIEGSGSAAPTAGVAQGTPVAGGSDTGFRTTLLAEPRSNSLIVRAANPRGWRWCARWSPSWTSRPRPAPAHRTATSTWSI